MTEDRILQITNDISEGIDNKETRAELREVVRYWSMLSATQASELAQLKPRAIMDDAVYNALLVRGLEELIRVGANSAPEE